MNYGSRKNDVIGGVLQ
jgi:hypothetical protein